MIGKILGGWLIIDGIGSVFKYRKQRKIEQLPRLLRAGIGFGLFALPL